MKKITACALAVLTITSLPSLAKDIEVKVTGSVTPSGCTPTLTSDGTVDYGIIKSDSLTLDAYTTLEKKELDLTIACDAPVKLALETKNGRPNTLAGVDTEDAVSGAGLSPVSGLVSGATAVVGLGLSNSARIGGYAISATGLKADGSTTPIITRGGSAGKWTGEDSSLYSVGVKRQLSWMQGMVQEPAAFKNLTINLTVQAYINKASELDLTKPVILDGLSTIELVYL